MVDAVAAAPVLDPAAAPAPVVDAAAAAAPADAPATIVSGDAAPVVAPDAAAAVPPGDWPSDWREKVAGNDAAYLKSLARLGSPLDLAKKARSLEQKLSSGEYLKPFPDKGTAEEQATWRKESGIPDKADGYLAAIKLNNGLVLGENDKPIAASFAEIASKNRWTPAQYNEAVSWYYDQQEAQKANQSDADANYHRENIGALGAVYGASLNRELGMVKGFLGSHFPKDVADNMLVARDSTGRMLGDNAQFIQALNALAREVSPLGVMLPAGTSDPAKVAADELGEIRASRRADPDGYNQNFKMQARELELIEAQLKVQKRSAA